jgi:hypothetical protein
VYKSDPALFAVYNKEIVAKFTQKLRERPTVVITEANLRDV